MVEIMKPDFINKSEKGLLTQLVHQGWKQVNVVKYKKGTISGGHYHKYNEECFYMVTGHISLTVWRKDGEKEEYEFRTGDMFKITKDVFHTLTYIEDSILVALYDNGVEINTDQKDIWTE